MDHEPDNKPHAIVSGNDAQHIEDEHNKEL